MDAHRAGRRADLVLRGVDGVPEGEDAAGDHRREGVRHRLLARLGGEGRGAPRRARRDCRELRADPPLEPGRHGRAPDGVRRRPDATDARAHRLRDDLDRGDVRADGAARDADGEGDGRRREGDELQGAQPDRHAGGDELLPARRDPALRAPPARGEREVTVRLLYNPASGRGRGGRAIAGTKAAFARFGFTDVRGTARAGDEARLVDEALQDGIETIVVAGGDGTWSKCAVPLARAGSPARMAFLEAGTGNDFAQNLRMPSRDPLALAKRIAEGAGERRVDLGRVDDTWFLNVAGFGFDVAVLRRSHGWRLLRGSAVYVVSAIQELVRFEGIDVAVDGAWGRRLMLVFSNGARFGGAFLVAPDAEVDDARLDALVVSDVPSLRRAAVLMSVLRATHRSQDAVRHFRTEGCRLEFGTPPWFEADGELHLAAGPGVEIASVPGALRVVDG
ncbi:MAG: diacylglycerol kinase family lipid kinase [Gemmatimonadales bacterium]|nr:diacylglycerol kinase family lipid kinase [Gemmatimonadales bacterium]